MAADLIMYEKIADPVSAVERMGLMVAKSKLFGCANEAQGQALVMMAMSDGVSITEMKRRYHIVSGTDLSMRADFMLAEFRRLGGEFTWIEDGDDGNRATLHVKYKTNDRQVSYTFEEAEREGLVKPKSRWEKNPGSMLRARAQTKAIRMVCPEVLAGFPTDDELDCEGNGQVVSPASVGSQPSAPASSAAASASTPDGDIIEAEFEVADCESKPEAKADTAPSDGPCDQSQIEKAKSLLRQVAQMEGNSGIADKLKTKLQSHGMSKLSDLSQIDADKLIEALTKKNMSLFFDASLAGNLPGEQS